MPKIDFRATVVVWCRQLNSPQTTQAMTYRELGLFNGSVLAGEEGVEDPADSEASVAVVPALFLFSPVAERKAAILFAGDSDRGLNLLRLFLLLLPLLYADFGEFTSFGICDTKHADCCCC